MLSNALSKTFNKERKEKLKGRMPVIRPIVTREQTNK